MAKKNVEKTSGEMSIEERLKNLYQLQTILSEIDNIRTIRGELPLEAGFRQFHREVAVEGDGGMHHIADVGRGVAFAAAGHLGAIYGRIGQSYIGFEVANGIADDGVLLFVLDTEEPDLRLLPVNIVVLGLTGGVDVRAPHAATILDLIGVAGEHEGIAVTGLHIHVGQVERGSPILAEAHIDLLGVVEAVEVQDEVDV